MNEYEIYNLKTNERTIIFGYNWQDACRRAEINPAEWVGYWMGYCD